MNTGSVRQPEFGRRLRQLRRQRGLSQRELAAGVINPSYISLLESGNRVPTLDVVVNIAQILNVPVAALLGEELLVSTEPAAVERDRDNLVQRILARSALDFGDLAAAARCYEEGYRRARLENQQTRALEAGLALQEVLAFTGEHAAQGVLLEELLELAVSHAPEIITTVMIDLAAVSRLLGQLARARELARRMLPEMEGSTLHGTSEHVRLLAVLVSVLCDSGEFGEAAPLVSRMLAIAEDLDSRPILGRAWWAASLAYARMGEHAKAKAYLQLAASILANPGTSLRDWCRFNRAAASILLDADGDLDDVRRYLTQAQITAEAAGMAQEQQQMDSVHARYDLARGEAASAEEICRRVDATEPPMAGFESARLYQTWGRALRQLGRRDEEAVSRLRTAALRYEELGAYRLAAAAWRELDEYRTE